MNAATEFDIGPLTWVKGEIDLALERATAALGQYGLVADATQLKFCRTHIHQVHGALSMVGLDGVTQVTESIEALLAAKEDGQLPAGEVGVAELQQAIAGLRQYLDDLLAGEPNQPLRLLPVYQALASARGLATFHPSDLFYPDLSLRPPRRTTSVPVLEAEPGKQALKAERMRYQKGLLSWLKKPAEAEAGRQAMRQALETIESLQETPAARAFWWVALAFLDSLADPALAADLSARQLCSHIDAQIRRLLEGSGAVAERVMREALFHVAHAPAGLAPLIDQVQSVFALPALIPAASRPAAPLPQEAALRKLRELIAGLEESWNKFCTGSHASLAGFAEHARSSARLTEEIGQTDLKRLGQGLNALASWLQEEPSRFNDTVAMEVATGILLMQHAQDAFARLGTDFAQQVDLMVARLYACIAGRPVSAEQAIPLLDEMTRKAQEKLLIGQVGREIQNNLAQIEQTLDSFFRDPAKGHDLSQLDAPLKQIGGALVMLGHFGAVASLKECSSRIQQFSQPTYQPVSADFEAVANQLSLLGFFVDALQHGETDFDAFVRRITGEKAPAEAPVSAVEPAPAVPAAEPGVALEIAEPPVAEPEPLQFSDEDFTREGAPAPSPLTLPEAPLPSAETLQLAESSHEAIDAELLAIFLEEACEVLDTLGEQVALLSSDPNDGDALTTIRRSTHTLKGSGRMVGLFELGDAAWELEQTLNLWLSQDQAVTPDLLRMISDEHALFATWVAHLSTGQGAAPNPAALVALARQLRGVEESPVPAVVSQLVELPEPEVADEAPSMRLELPILDGLAESPVEIEPPAVSPMAPVEEDLHLQAAADALADLLVPEAPVLRSTPETGQIPPTVTASPTLYDIFSDEARGHLLTLVESYAQLEANPGAPTTFEMTRAAHTLGGIAATVGLMPLHHLAVGLEHALLRRDSSARPDSIEGLETVRQAIITLEEMFAGLALQQPPEEQPQLIAALEDVFLAASPLPTPAVAAVDAARTAEMTADALGDGAPESTAPPLPLLTDELDEQLLPIFLEEASDQLRDLTTQLRAWRADPAGGTAPQAIARLLHTFKGNARMAGAMNLGEATHLLESRFEAALHAGDTSADLIDEIENGCDALAQAVERLREGSEAPPELQALPDALPASAAALPARVEADADAEHGGQHATLRVRADLVDRLVNEAGELSIARARIEGEMRSLKASLLDLTENVIRLRRQLREIEIQAEGQIQAHVAHAPSSEAEFDPLELDRFTRFQELTRFMAESVNDVATVQQNLLKNLDDANAAILAQSRLNRGLQQALMSVRMVPFASQSERLYRIVRQTAKEVGKRANLDIVGAQAEIDRSVLDKMMAPIEHMLRNAVTHGIESREQRIAAGKPDVGEISLTLGQEGNEIILTMADDGKGLDTPRIRTRAEAMGLLAAGQAVDEATLADFIFQPGFSTATELTQVSGRGVGMDVVRTEVTALGGRIEIQSQAGQGTRFRLYLPLTLAVTQTLLVRVGNQRYAVPSNMIEQVLELKEKALAGMRASGEAEWQNNHYPLHFLANLLGDAAAQPETQRKYWILLLRSGTQRVAVQVDELKGNQEVVVKNIGAQLARVVGIAGATVLGDGQVVLILNPVALASRGVVAQVGAGVAVAEPVARVSLPTVMVVDDSLTVRKITSRLLAREGYQVILAKDGVDALEQLQDVVPDVVLSDIEMPRMDGFDLVRNIRADERLKSLPIIMITSRTADKHRNHALEIGANHYLGKPYDEDTLLGLLAGYIQAKASA